MHDESSEKPPTETPLNGQFDDDHPLRATRRPAAGGEEPPEDHFSLDGGEPGAPRAKRRRGAWGWAFLLVGWGAAASVLLGIVGGVGALVYVNRLGRDLPDYQVLSDYEPPVTTRIYAGDGSLIAEYARERRLFVPIEAIPDEVKYAFISAEDKSFYEHDGLDYRGIARAALANIMKKLSGRGGPLEGGSTITQQVAKNFLLSSEQRLDRKIKEMILARRIEHAFTKDQILELYLNEIYLGNRSYGVAAAALNYFGKSLEDLTVDEAAYLAVLPKGPSNYNPERHAARAVSRRNWVIGRMLEDGRITTAQAEEATAQPLGATLAPPLGAIDDAYGYFAEEVRKEVVGRYGTDALYDGGLAVRTTLSPRLQEAAQKALRDGLVAYDERHGWRGPVAHMEEFGEDWAEALSAFAQHIYDQKKAAPDMGGWRLALVLEASADEAKVGFMDASTGGLTLDSVKWAKPYVSADREGEAPTKVSDVVTKGDVVYVEQSDAGLTLRQIPAANGALVAIDPHTGRVLALAGGFSFELSEFNRAIQAHRQPGSTFKPFVYATALDHGYTPSSIVLDAPFVAPGVDEWWKPGNYEAGRFFGPTTLRRGVEKSRNTMTARLAQDVGIGPIIDTAQRFGVSDHLPHELAVSLGAAETTLMDLTTAYAMFVNGGREISPVMIDRIQDRFGQAVYKRDNRECPNCDAAEYDGQPAPQLPDNRARVIDPRTAYQIVSILQGVVQRGTGSRVRAVITQPIAGKTGTTNDYKDAWFVGFTPDLAAGVYVGFDLPSTLGHGESGGIVAAPIFAQFMKDTLGDSPGIPFRVPPGIQLVRVNAITGLPAKPGESNVITEAFKAGDLQKLAQSRPLLTNGDERDQDALKGLY